MIPVVLSGGSGTRLWPLSRGLYPKQFLPLVTEKTMLQETLLRLNGLSDLSGPVVVCNEDHRFIVAEQLREIDITPHRIILEPIGRNTAPAVALAALTAESPDDVLLVLAADHVIRDIATFQNVVDSARDYAESGALVTFGIVPTDPATGYGYIKRGEEITGAAYKVNRFVEKPDLDTAVSYLADGGYYWNSGMFAFRASTYLAELEKHNPEMIEVCKAVLDSAEPAYDFVRLERSIFEKCPSDSIDYAVMEKTEKRRGHSPGCRMG